MRFGAHCVLYGPETGTDPRAVISRLAKTGAQGCELGERFFGVDRREELSAILVENHMELAGMHCNGLNLMDILTQPDTAMAALEKVAGFMAPLKNKNVIATGGVPVDEIRGCPISGGAPSPDLHDPDKVKELAIALNGMVREIREKYGVQVHYHNHSWEFADKGLIWFALAEYAPDLKFALDTGWAAASGFGPLELIKQYPGRFDYIHLRDCGPLKGNPQENTFDQTHKGFKELGTGGMGYPGLIRGLKDVLREDAWAIVEYEIGNFDQNSYLGAIHYLKGLQDMADEYRKEG